MNARFFIRLSVLLATLLTLPAAAQQPIPPWFEQSPPVLSRPEAVDACPAWRWIGVKADPCLPCPAPRQPGWTVRPLFPDPDRGQTLPPLGLRSFCLYEHRGRGGELTTAELPGLLAVDRDCMAVLPAAPPILLQRTLPEQEARFLRHAGVVAGSPPGPANPPPVRLALLDTAPTSKDPTRNPNNTSLHGYSLANMAKKLVCQGGAGPCVAQVTSRLALARVIYNPASGAMSAPDPVRGGTVGTIGDLAEAIRLEALDWQQPGPQQVPLLNLSLGWNGRLFGGLESDLSSVRPAVRAVHAALTDALCRGATVLAAAGNRSWGPAPELSRGPLLPAAWEARPAPTPAACLAALSPAGPPLIPAGGGLSYRPLVHAVGAVRASGEPLENSRFQAEPRLVAFGDHAVVADGFNRPEMLTGSSVSTVVAAAALAWVRRQLPGLDAFAAVDRLHHYSLERSRTAAFCLGGNEPSPCPGPVPVRHVKVAEAARRACLECRGPGCARPCPPGELPVSRISFGPSYDLRALFSSAERIHLRTLRSANPPTDAACPPGRMTPWLGALPGGGASERLFLRASALPERRCPHWQLFDANLQAQGGPQPGSNPCSTCTLEPPPTGGGGGGSTTAFLEIDPDYSGRLTSAVLKAGSQTYALGNLAPGAKLVVEGLPAGLRAGDVQLSFEVNGVSSTTSLFFVPD